jgi:hypothetical protein
MVLSTTKNTARIAAGTRWLSDVFTEDKQGFDTGFIPAGEGTRKTDDEIVGRNSTMLPQ